MILIGNENSYFHERTEMEDVISSVNLGTLISIDMDTCLR